LSIRLIMKWLAGWLLLNKNCNCVRCTWIDQINAKIRTLVCDQLKKLGSKFQQRISRLYLIDQHLGYFHEKYLHVREGKRFEKKTWNWDVKRLLNFIHSIRKENSIFIKQIKIQNYAQNTKNDTTCIFLYSFWSI